MILTKEEQGVMNLLATAWNAFVELPSLHEWDRREFMHAIHNAQNIVMSRPVLRERNGIASKPESSSPDLTLSDELEQAREAFNAISTIPPHFKDSVAISEAMLIARNWLVAHPKPEQRR
jgi:hypothetical protein